MELNEQEFWRQLRTSADAADADQAAELAQAEQFLADLDDDEAAPLTDERVAAMVAAATEDDGGDAAASTGRIVRFPRLQRYLAAAAAVVLAPKFLVAATAVTVVAVSAYMIQHSTFTLPYQDAIVLMMNEGGSEQERRSGQATVVGVLVDSIQIVRGTADETAPIAINANDTLARLRQALTNPSPFEPVRFPDPHAWLGDMVADGSLAFEERQDALARLTDQLLLGLFALKAVELAPGPTALKRDNSIYLARLSSALGM